MPCRGDKAVALNDDEADRLAELEQKLAQGEQLVARITTLIDRRKALGLDVRETQRLLENLLRLMEAYSASRTLLILHMDRAAKGPDNAAERPR
jgi:hypothetical protein